MLYMGTEEAKILSYNLKDLFARHVNRGAPSLEAERLGEDELRRILEENDAKLQRILNEK
jgi:hypothetical protein